MKQNYIIRELALGKEIDTVEKNVRLIKDIERECADYRVAILRWTVSMYFDGKSKK